jgi:cell division ATPase FtsA
VKVGANFHIITGDKNAIRNINRSVEKSGLITKDLVLQPLASSAAVMAQEDWKRALPSSISAAVLPTWPCSMRAS